MNKLKHRPKPTEAELEILEILWEHGPATVRQVNDLVNQRRETGYTTTLKIIQIMYAKEMLSRREEGRTHIYTPLAEEQETRQHLLEKFMETSFRGSAASLVMQALGNGKTTKDELKQIRQLLDQLEGGKK
ncbi:putative transcriptional regulator [Anseongella ginsenosidimutans]|uniref:Putative transcriptional regulator n=1 Tax=Anseongella ginsenosidimutans TaxID=496056 RepID=A0A4R3KWU1_9SPHI|nr:BlaI/MecI/CopY family transcriptional regulator [Anseongella ginsenosidimutans]QEC51220.1 BlaI/MecI/CopY family transcriptional regulator [Anseongella ginsenosidimutans]TCS90105.1 putative transcriptional regulator [Anseongella ginsenosidimutans]